MGKKKIPPKLTMMHAPEIERAFKATVPGQAHFAGTGPAGAMCHGCEHWGAGGTRPLTMWQKARCAQFKVLTGKAGAPVPGRSSPCRHFVPRT